MLANTVQALISLSLPQTHFPASPWTEKVIPVKLAKTILNQPTTIPPPEGEHSQPGLSERISQPAIDPRYTGPLTPQPSPISAESR